MDSVPKHIAIIPDGNRRWARSKGLSDLEGHMEGVRRTLDIVEKAHELGVEVITFWGFSTENWKRDGDEVSYLMKDIFINQGKKFLQKFYDQKARFIHLGRKDRLPKELVSILSDLEEKTKEFVGRTVCFAIDYGGRNEILRAIQNIVESGAKSEEITEEFVGKLLDTKGIPDPDMIIRTSGEQRLSGLMPWQSVYAELFFVPIFYPEFTKDKFEEVVSDFANRQRRFGGK